MDVACIKCSIKCASAEILEEHSKNCFGPIKHRSKRVANCYNYSRSYYNIDSRHQRGWCIKNEDVTIEETDYTWTVRSQANPSECYTVERVAEYCDCYMKCNNFGCLDLCSDLYICDCPDSNEMCKHIHKVHIINCHIDWYEESDDSDDADDETEESCDEQSRQKKRELKLKLRNIKLHLLKAREMLKQAEIRPGLADHMEKTLKKLFEKGGDEEEPNRAELPKMLRMLNCQAATESLPNA